MIRIKLDTPIKIYDIMTYIPECSLIDDGLIRLYYGSISCIIVPTFNDEVIGMYFEDDPTTFLIRLNELFNIKFLDDEFLERYLVDCLNFGIEQNIEIYYKECKNKYGIF